MSDADYINADLDRLVLSAIAAPKPLRAIAAELDERDDDVARSLRRLKHRGQARCNLMAPGVPSTYWQATRRG